MTDLSPRPVWLLSLTLIAVFSLATACGGGGKKPAGGSPTPKPDGQVATPATSPTPLTELPEGILDEFPSYPGAELVESDEERKKVRATYETGDSSEEVLAFYQDALNQAPWLVQTVIPANESTTLVLFISRNDSDISGTVAVLVPEDSDRTEVVVEIVLPGGADLTPTPGGQ